METSHTVHVGDARDLSAIDEASVELVVTSPPYPMIEMWDDVFAGLNPDISSALDAGSGREAFELMHDELAAVWRELDRVLIDAGVVCVNIGDATRSVDDSFELYSNHAAVIDWFTQNGYRALPDIVWRKPTNSATKFMGSGMLPPNAHVTLEHEYILVFRKGPRNRSFEAGDQDRYEAAYFWEERNEWFSDVWTDIKGALQDLDGASQRRDRSGAFPFAVPYRLVNMYSVYGDTVLDPFWGTGTTTLAALAAGRSSIGVEIEPDMLEVFYDRLDAAPAVARSAIERRLDRHAEFVSSHQASDGSFKYSSNHYGFPVKTRQEQAIRFYALDSIDRSGRTLTATHRPVAPAVTDELNTDR